MASSDRAYASRRREGPLDASRDSLENPFLLMISKKIRPRRRASLTNAKPTQNDPHNLRRLRRPTGLQRAAMCAVPDQILSCRVLAHQLDWSLDDLELDAHERKVVDMLLEEPDYAKF